jgi:hypothetical protein
VSTWNSKYLRHSVRGMRGTVAELATHFGVVTPRRALDRVTNSGWSVEDAVTTPTNQNRGRRPGR